MAMGLVFNFSDVLNILFHVFSLGDDVVAKVCILMWSL